jgi:hypothetical protein
MSIYYVFVNAKKIKWFFLERNSKDFVINYQNRHNCADNDIWIYRHSVFQNRITHYINLDTDTNTWREVVAW